MTLFSELITSEFAKLRKYFPVLKQWKVQ